MQRSRVKRGSFALNFGKSGKLKKNEILLRAGHAIDR
jgi:hypothetical protein